MKPTPDQCRLALCIGAALIHQGGRAATDLIRAAQAESPVLDSRLTHLLGAVDKAAINSDVADWVQEFYRGNEGYRRGGSIRIRLSAAEKDMLEAQAQETGETVSAYVRRMCGLIGDGA